MYLKSDGKCEYCGRDMVLSLSMSGSNLDNLATFDHKYNRDHEKRNEVEEGERRIFIVCKKCNNARNKSEPNKQEPHTLEKSVRRIVPKEAWSDEKFMDIISKVTQEEIGLSKMVCQLDKQIKGIQHQKKQLAAAISKKVKSRNLLMSHWADSELKRKS